jgi:hypothetical protein
MEQLILHLIGDYITQTHVMATRKTSDLKWAAKHALVYSLPFLLIGSIPAVFVIFVTHYLVDSLRLAKYVNTFKNWLGTRSIQPDENGYPVGTPAGLSLSLFIITDNTLHLICNYLALYFL